MKYTCPSCSKDFDKAAKGSICPHCGVLLKSKRRFENGKLVGWYYEVDSGGMVQEHGILAKDNTLKTKELIDITTTSESPEKLSSKYPFRLTEPGQLPVVIQSGDNEFDVYFQHMMYTGMVYCPKCQSPAFQNMQLFGDLEHLCTERIEKVSCSAKTIYHFNDPVGVEVN